MSNALSAEAFLPCLLDRLCDDEPDNQQEVQYRQSLTISHYRKSVLRDLGNLLNAPSHVEEDGLEAFPEANVSVINFGTPDLCGKTTDNINAAELEAEVARAITNFEPRVIRHTVKVIPGVNKSSPNKIGFEIRGVMWANPLPEQFVLETQLDLETGQCLV